MADIFVSERKMLMLGDYDPHAIPLHAVHQEFVQDIVVLLARKVLWKAYHEPSGIPDKDWYKKE